MQSSSDTAADNLIQNKRMRTVVNPPESRRISRTRKKRKKKKKADDGELRSLSHSSRLLTGKPQPVFDV